MSARQRYQWLLGGGAILALLLAAALLSPPFVAAPQDEDAREEGAEGDPATLASLQEQIRELQAMLERLDGEAAAEIEELKRRIGQLEAQLEEAQRPSGEGSAPEDEIEALREAARAEVPEESQEEQDAQQQREAMTGRQRSQQDLNPEISFLGDVSYDWSDSEIQNQFVIRAVEIGFEAPLDPYTRFKGFLSAHQEPPQLEFGIVGDDAHGVEVELEEAYMDWVALPGGTGVRVGKFRQRFGTLNRWHPHALASTESSFALRNLFGHEGLNGIGVGVSWALPGFWATSHGLVIEITNPDNEVAFAGADFSDPAFLLRYTGFYDLNPDSYLEIGLNGTTGPNDEASNGRTTIASIDINYLWEPASRARYRGFEFRGEYFWSGFEDTTTPGVEQTWEQTWRTNSYYAYLVWKLNRQWQLGFRYDDAELPSPRSETASGVFREGLQERAITPFVTFWQSEFVRLRLQYQHAERNFIGAQGPDDDDRVWLQVTWAAGPHKHEAY
jgi:hypothetical protein